MAAHPACFLQELCKPARSRSSGEELAQCLRRVKALENLPWLSVLNYLQLSPSRMA